MAYDERLAARTRAILADRRGISERRMFGGIAFLVDGKMCVGIVNDDLMVRTGAERYAEALGRPHARPMDFTGRVSKGAVYVAPPGIVRADALRRWIEVGLAAAAEAPRKRRATATARPRARSGRSGRTARR